VQKQQLLVSMEMEIVQLINVKKDGQVHLLLVLLLKLPELASNAQFLIVLHVPRIKLPLNALVVKLDII
jgi:hypothetical protein